MITDKYQVLIDAQKRHAIIEKTSNGSGKDVWNVYIPDAGDANAARKVARLLNEEHERDTARRAAREVTS